MISRSTNHIQEYGCNNSISTRKKNHSQTFTVLVTKNYGIIVVVDSNSPIEVIRYIEKVFIRECRDATLD